MKRHETLTFVFGRPLQGKMAEAIGGPGKVSGGTKTGRVDKRFNAWGSEQEDITEELKAQGVVQYDVLTGEDIRKVGARHLGRECLASALIMSSFMRMSAGPSDLVKLGWAPEDCQAGGGRLQAGV